MRCSHSAVKFESLESRRLMSMAPAMTAGFIAESHPVIHQADGVSIDSLDGTYNGTATIGNNKNVPVTVTIDKGGQRIRFTSPKLPKVFRPKFNPHFFDSPDDKKKHDFKVGFIDPKAGSGTIQITDGKTLEINGTIDPIIFDPFQFSFNGSKTSNAAPLAETLSVKKKPRNPILGIYKGTMVNSRKGSFAFSVQVTKNKLGHPALHFQTFVSNVLEVDVDVVIHPHISGSFSQPLGTLPGDGTISGHLTHTGKFVFTVFSPAEGTTTGSIKRLA